MFADHLSTATELFDAACTKLAASAVDQVVHANAVADADVRNLFANSLDTTSERQARERVDAMCRKLLANHVIEDYHFDLERTS